LDPLVRFDTEASGTVPQTCPSPARRTVAQARQGTIDMTLQVRDLRAERTL
jgi:hypothetical protein